MCDDVLLSRGGGVGGRDTADGVRGGCGLVIWVFFCDKVVGLRSRLVGVDCGGREPRGLLGGGGDALNFLRFRDTVD